MGAIGRRVPSPCTERVVGRVPHPGQRGLWEGLLLWEALGKVLHPEQRANVRKSPALIRAVLWKEIPHFASLTVGKLLSP